MEKTLGTRPPITFSDEDLVGVLLPHDDALVVTLGIAHYDVRRILINNGSNKCYLLSHYGKDEPRP